MISRVVMDHLRSPALWTKKEKDSLPHQYQVDFRLLADTLVQLFESFIGLELKLSSSSPSSLPSSTSSTTSSSSTASSVFSSLSPSFMATPVSYPPTFNSTSTISSLQGKTSQVRKRQENLTSREIGLLMIKEDVSNRLKEMASWSLANTSDNLTSMENGVYILNQWKKINSLELCQ